MGTGSGGPCSRTSALVAYTGDVHVVHPRGLVIEGVRTARSFADLPTPVDLAIIAVPAPRVLDAVTDAAEAGVPVAVVISSGFQELGTEGARLQHELAVLARARSIRVVGPNCLGVMSNQPEIQLNATFTRVLPPDGGLAVATQSGGVGIVLADLARQLGLGIGSLVSLGNKVDVSGNDLLAAWTDDPGSPPLRSTSSPSATPPSSPASPVGSPNASRCWPSSADVRTGAAAPAPRTPRPPRLRRSVSPRSSPRRA